MARSTSSSSTLLVVIILVITFPIWFAIGGVIFGLIVGLFGVIMGIFGGLLGLLVGLIALPFELIFGGSILGGHTNFHPSFLLQTSCQHFLRQREAPSHYQVLAFPREKEPRV